MGKIKDTVTENEELKRMLKHKDKQINRLLSVLQAISSDVHVAHQEYFASEDIYAEQER